MAHASLRTGARGASGPHPSRRAVRRRCRTWLVPIVVCVACERPADNGPVTFDAGPPSARAAARRAKPAITAIDDEGMCVLGYEGTVLDLGDPSLRTRFGPKL